MNPAALEGIIKEYDSRIPAPVFMDGTKGGGNFDQQTLTYAAAIAIELQSGNHAIVSVTDAVAFVFSAPTYGGVAFAALSSSLALALSGMVLRLTIRNTAGVAHGAGTFNAAFKTAGAVAAIATGNNRSMEFVWNGVNWIEQWRGAADVAN